MRDSAGGVSSGLGIRLYAAEEGADVRKFEAKSVRCKSCDLVSVLGEFIIVVVDFGVESG